MRYAGGQEGGMNFLDDLNSTNRPDDSSVAAAAATVAPDAGNTGKIGTSEKGQRKSSKSPASGSKHFFSSPATILRPDPDVPPKM